jgi:prepilin-type processing-associated H-X9-DG protein
MKGLRKTRVTAFTRIELLVVLVVVALMAALVLPGLERVKQKRWRIQCTDNLKQIGMAFRTFAIDHDGELPAQVYMKRMGTAGGNRSVEAWRIFQVMSNEMSTPNVLICPADTRVPASILGPGFSNTNLSYFVSLDAAETFPSMFLCGDRNLTNGLPVENGILVLTTNRPFGWTHELHNGQGNVALADGSVQGWTSSRLQGLLGGGITDRLAMP